MADRLFPSELDMFTRHYLAAALQLCDEELGPNATADELAPEALAKVVADCTKFQTDNADLLARAYANCEGRPQGVIEQWQSQGGTDYTEGRAGSSFWLNRNGHGSGFWDYPGIWGEEEAAALDKACELFHEADLYRGDDGLIYQSPV